MTRNNTLVFEVPALLRSFRGIRFRAERWTKRAPFAFAVDVRQNARWKQVAQLDDTIRVGARFLSDVRLAIPESTAPTTAIRFRVTAAGNAGLLIDDLALLKDAPTTVGESKSRPAPTRPLRLINSQPIFVSGTNDTHTYRIPAIVTATNGDLVAACDARRQNSRDLMHHRTIDIVCRRSQDNGKTWSPIQLVETLENGGCSDPSLLVDRVTGEIFCFYNFMVSDTASKEFRFLVQSSRDHGRTWSKPIDFTDQVAPPELKNNFKFVTSGRGIQLRNGTLLHNFVRVGKGATLFASHDHGRSWKPAGDVAPADESKVVQLADGSLMVNARYKPGQRYVHHSTDGGTSWASRSFQPPDPRCNAAILQFTAKRDGYLRDRLLFCNAASNQGRRNLAVRISYDNGTTWSGGKVVDTGPSAYSELTVLNDGTIGILYEPGHGEIKFARFSLEALTDGQDKLTKAYQPPPVARK